MISKPFVRVYDLESSSNPGDEKSVTFFGMVSLRNRCKGFVGDLQRSGMKFGHG